MSSSSTHIRPKVRRNTNRSVSTESPTDEPASTEEQSPATTTMSASPRSILRKPKYGSKQEVVGVKQPLEDSNRGLQQHQSTLGREEEEEFPNSSSVTPPVVRATVMERPRQKRNKSKKAATSTTNPSNRKDAATSIEGYTPRRNVQTNSSKNNSTQKHDNQRTTPQPATQENDVTTKTPTATTKPRTKEEEALILNSLAELMETSGISLPEKNTPVSEAAVVEADLSFSVMTAEDYDQLKQQDRQAQYEVFLGKPSVFQETSNDETDKENSVEDATDEHENQLLEEEDNSDGQENVDDGLLDDVFGDDSDDEEEVITREPRAFMKLWSALSQWVTPEAVAFVKVLRSSGDDRATRDVQSAVDRSDLGAGRCAGLMVMIQMYIRTALEELGHELEERRTTERLVGDLLRMFDYSRPSPQLDVAHSKAMTVVLLQTVLYNPAVDSMQVPASCQALGMTMDEFRYLTISAICNLETPSS